MTFGSPAYLWLLILVVIAAAVFAGWAAWRLQAQRRFGAGARTGASAFGAPLLLLAAAAIAIVAAARPQIGERETVVERRGIDMVIVLDVSLSMAATDVEPSRIARAQAEIGALLDRMEGDRVGLVIFAGRPFTRSPLTSDIAALDRMIAGVHEERGLVAAGSDIGEAIRRGTAVLSRGEAETRVMLVVSDGENHGPFVESAVENARRERVTVYTAGAGTPQGAPVIDVDPDTGMTQPRTGSGGEPVVTRLDAATLQQIAQAGGGRYVELSGDGRPLANLATEFAALDATTFEQAEQSTPIDRYRVFAALALALAVAATLWSGAAGLRALSPRSRVVPLAGALLLIGAVCGDSVADVTRRGNEQYRDEDYAASVNTYRTAQAMDPERAELYHNAGNALNRLNQLDAAIEETRRGLASAGPFASVLEYALGNHHARNGQLIDALEAYKRSLLADPNDADAKHNLEVIRALLDATPSPTPTPAPPEIMPTPGVGEGEGDPGSAPDPRTPAGGEDNGDTGTPGPGTPQPADGEMTDEQLQRALEEALAGIDEEFTVDEAIRVLELLERRNRSQLTEPGRGIGGAPDY